MTTDQPVRRAGRLSDSAAAEVLALADAAAAADGVFSRSAGELVVHPGFRRRGHGTALVKAALAGADRAVQIWAHGDQPAARAFAEKNGFERTRVLWQM